MGLIRLEFRERGNTIASMRPILDVPSAGHKPKLLDQVRDVIRRKHYSLRTEQAYVDWIKRFIIYHKKRHPAEMAEEEVAQFLTNCASDIQITPGVRQFRFEHRLSSFESDAKTRAHSQSCREMEQSFL